MSLWSKTRIGIFPLKNNFNVSRFLGTVIYNIFIYGIIIYSNLSN